MNKIKFIKMEKDILINNVKETIPNDTLLGFYIFLFLLPIFCIFYAIIGLSTLPVYYLDKLIKGEKE